MKPSAVVLILRKNQVFDTAGAIIHHNYGTFAGFKVKEVQAAYRSERPIDGYGVALVQQPSQADIDFKDPTLFLTENDVCHLLDAFVHSDELTEKLLGRSWTRPSPECQDLIIKVVLRLITVSPDFGIRLARGVESSTKRLAKLLQDHAAINGRLLRGCQP